MAASKIWNPETKTFEVYKVPKAPVFTWEKNLEKDTHTGTLTVYAGTAPLTTTYEIANELLMSTKVDVAELVKNSLVKEMSEKLEEEGISGYNVSGKCEWFTELDPPYTLDEDVPPIWIGVDPGKEEPQYVPYAAGTDFHENPNIPEPEPEPEKVRSVSLKLSDLTRKV